MSSSSARGDPWDEEYYEEEVDEDSSWVEWEIPVDVESIVSLQRDHPFDESTQGTRIRVRDPSEPQASPSRVESGDGFSSFQRDRPFCDSALGTRFGAPDPPELLASRFCVEGGEQKTDIFPIRGARDPPEARYDQLEPSVQLSTSSMSRSSIFEVPEARYDPSVQLSRSTRSSIFEVHLEPSLQLSRSSMSRFSIFDVPHDQLQLTEQISKGTLSTKSEERYLGISNKRVVQKPQMLPDEEQPSSDFASKLVYDDLREEQASSIRSRTEDQVSVPASASSSIVKVEDDPFNPELDSVRCRGSPDVPSEFEHTQDKFQATVQRKGHDQWKVLILALLYVLVVVVVVLAILYFVLFKDKDGGVILSGGDNGATKLPTMSPTGSAEWLPSVSCSGKVTTLTAKTIAEYDRLATELMVPSLYSTWDHNIESCRPANQAALWMSAEPEAFSDEGTPNLLQRYIVAFLFFSSGGADWTSHDKWLSQHDVCDWEGLGCSSDGDLVEINLEGNSLKGHLISELGILSKLQVLNLQQNALSGSLPTEVASLDGLQIMEVSRNNLGGKIPHQVSASAQTLVQLNLSQNRFSGAIPTQVGRATLLKKLDISHNKLDGKVPTQLNLLSKLSFFNIENNAHITGQLSSQYGRFGDLSFLSISNTAIQARIPRQYAALRNLEDFRLANTLVGGDIPQAVASMTNLRHLDLSSSRFRNSIPSFIGSLSKLTHLSLNNNSLTGPIPTLLGRLSRIRLLTLDDNLLTGAVPSQLAAISNLEVFTLHHSFLTGRIPDEICSLREFGLKVFTIPCPTGTAPGHHFGVTCPVPNCCSSCVGPLQSALP